MWGNLLFNYAIPSLLKLMKEEFSITLGFDSRNTVMHNSPLKVLLKKAGLPDIRFHDLRHSAATLLLTEGVHPKIVQELLGHSNISMTMDVYSHVLPNMQQNAISRLNNALSKYEGDGSEHAQA
jgi:integrase